jgi:hypothetical protein
MRNALKRVLENENFNVLVAEDGFALLLFEISLSRPSYHISECNICFYCLKYVASIFVRSQIASSEHQDQQHTI